jgi:hypothetical protein
MPDQDFTASVVAQYCLEVQQLFVQLVSDRTPDQALSEPLESVLLRALHQYRRQSDGLLRVADLRFTSFPQ